MDGIGIVSGKRPTERKEFADITSGSLSGRKISLTGAVHSLRDMGDFRFIILRRWDGLIQCVQERSGQEWSEPEQPGQERCSLVQGKQEQSEDSSMRLREGMTVKAEGIVREETRAPGGYEVLLTNLSILSEPESGTMMPLPIGKRRLNTALETKLSLRPIALRNVRERAVFKIQEGIVRGFRDYLYGEHFTEIRTPKIVAGNAEGGANVFKLEYFGKRAFLAQSPQFYKQMMVGVYDRVFETGPVFRAEKHNTVRHLNEYTSLDLEMGYIESFRDIMEIETETLRHIFGLLSGEYAKELELLGAEPPKLDGIPFVRFSEAKRLASEKYGRPIREPYDLEPEEEMLIGRYFKEEYGSDFVFVTHYPSKKRPFYAMDDPEDRKFTLSFDLLYKGMEITTGGQRIHSYEDQIRKMQARGMDPADFETYLMIHKHGMPPHGGLGIGLERLTMKLLGEANVRETALFPRDVTRLAP